MNQKQAEEIANKYHIDYGPVTFYSHGRGYIIRGMNCYDRIVEIFFY